MKYELSLDGMSCGHCVKAVQEALDRVEGLTTEHVEIGRAVVEVEDMLSIQASLLAELDEEGYPMINSELV